MKKSIIFAFAMVFAVAANANSVSKKAKASKATVYTVSSTEYNKEGKNVVIPVDAFDIAKIDVPARVRIIEGNEYGVNIIALNGAAKRTVRYSVVDGTLRIYSTALEELDNNSMIINLVVPAAPVIKTAGNLDKMSVR